MNNEFKVKMKKIPISYNKNIDIFITYLFALSSDDYYIIYEDVKKKLESLGPEYYYYDNYLTIFFCYLKKFDYDLDFTITIKDKNKKDFIFAKDWFNDSYKKNIDIDNSTVNIKLIISSKKMINSREKDIFLKILENLYYNYFYPIKDKFQVID